MDIIESMVRDNLKNILTYEPVEPISLISRKFGIPENQIIKLNGNIWQYLNIFENTCPDPPHTWEPKH